VVAKKLDRRLAALGGRAAAPRRPGAAPAPPPPEAALDAWLPGLWAALRAAAPLPPGLADVRRSQAWFACRACLCRARVSRCRAAWAMTRRPAATRPRWTRACRGCIWRAARLRRSARPGRCARWLL